MTRPLDQILADWFDVADRLDQLQQAKAALAAELRELGPGRHNGTAGTATISAPTARFDPAKAAEVLPADMLEACRETVITASRAKAVLPPALYELCQVASGDPRVTVKAGS